MNIKLVVVRPFGSYRRGDEVTDTGEIARIQTGEAAGNVVRVLLPIPPGSSNGGSV